MDGPLVEKAQDPGPVSCSCSSISCAEAGRENRRDGSDKEQSSPLLRPGSDVKAEYDCSNTTAKLVLSQRDITVSQVINSFSKTVPEQKETHIF